MHLSKVISGLILFIIFCEYTYAVPPPDFIIQAASQLISFFTIWVVLLSGIYATGIQFLKAYYIEHKKPLLILWIPSIIIFAWIWAYYANNYYQWLKQAEYNQSWIKESYKNTLNSPIWEQKQHTISQSISWEIYVNSWISYSSWGSTITNMSWTELWPITTISPILTWELNNNWDYFEKNKYINLKITNNELKKIIEWNNKDYIILDAREDVEYENGHIPNSTHIRFADIKDGKWSEIIKNKYIVVLCWSGMRGKEVAEYLRDKNIVGRYLENWVDGWVNFGWSWQGEVKFSKIYGKNNYNLVFSTDQVRQKSKQWVILIDSRSPEKYSEKHIDWSINISMMSTASNKVDWVFWVINKGTRIIVICDEYINCFDAKLTGIELEKRWAIFLGRYNTPWEY